MKVSLSAVIYAIPVAQIHANMDPSLTALRRLMVNLLAQFTNAPTTRGTRALSLV